MGDVIALATRRRPVLPVKSEVTTPPAFLQAVECRFGRIVYDLAARPENAVATKFFTPEENSLKQDWRALRGVLFCHPPFADIRPWVAKASESKTGGLNRMDRGDGRYNTIIMLLPASIGATWFADYCFGSALVMGLVGRILGQKDMMLCVWSKLVTPRFVLWEWKKPWTVIR